MSWFETFNIKEHRLAIERVSACVRANVLLRNARYETYVEEEDFGREIMYELIAHIAALPERGKLTITRPSRWIDYVLTGIIQKTGWLWLTHRVKWKREDYEAIHYLPDIELPPEKTINRFSVWVKK